MSISFDLGKTIEERDRIIQLAMICLGVGILTADVFLPLGFVIWILYLMPLLMSVWLTHRFAPFFTAWLITGAIFLGSFISMGVRTNPFDLPNRAIFVLMMAIVALLVWEIRSNYANLEKEIEQRRSAQESLEELTQSLEERIYDRTHELAEVNTALITDIAQRRKVEAALETANKKLSLLSQITRHDISNRVFALLVDIDLAKDPASECQLRESLDRMEKTANSIQDQIAFTKDYQEIGAQAPSWQNVGSVIKGAQEQLDLSTVQITINLEGVELFADPMIGRVFYNLINNAIRHGDHVTRITFSYYLSANNMVMVCEDNGTGIPSEEKQQIFTKGFGRDTGLGLFLIREILSITGMSIRETGEYGKGARFEIMVHSGDYRIGKPAFFSG